MIDHAIEGILLVAPSGKVLESNPAAARILGYDNPADLMFLVSDCLPMFVDHGDGDEPAECQVERKDGSFVWVELKRKTFRPADGGIYHLVFFNDISERKNAEAKYHALVENAPFGIYRSSLNGRFLDVNHALVAMLGYESRDEVMALNIEKDVYCEPDLRGRLIRQFGDVERIENIEVVWKRKDGHSIQVRLSARKVRDEVGVLEGFEIVAQAIPAVYCSAA